MTSTTPESLSHEGEAHGVSASGMSSGAKLNWLRAGVLGANDGIVSISGLVIGVAAAGASTHVLLTAGLAGVASGALSMAAGEYVSVSTQRDTEAGLIAKERRELAENPEAELMELAGIYQAKGLGAELALDVAKALHEHDALAAHAEAELKIDHEELTNPWHAAIASMFAFTIGAVLPMLTIVLLAPSIRMWATVIAAALALAVTGWISARLGGASEGRAVIRVVLGGLAAMAVTFAIGSVLGTQVA